MNGSPPEASSVSSMDFGPEVNGPERNLGAEELPPRSMQPTVLLPLLSRFTSGPLAEKVKAYKESLLQPKTASGVIIGQFGTGVNLAPESIWHRTNLAPRV